MNTLHSNRKFIQIKSIKGTIWNVPSENVNIENIFFYLSKRLGISITETDSFLNTKLTDVLPDPYSLLEMKAAVTLIKSAIHSKKKITIFGDYDVDGACATAILVKFLNTLNVDCSYIIPNRFSDGYGLNQSNLSQAVDSLAIAVDCGSSSLKELEYANSKGIDIIVIDHHEMSEISKYGIIVNPFRPDESGKLKNVCATTLVFLFVLAVTKALKADHDILQNTTLVSTLNPYQYLDLVALATICDVMPLTTINRPLVQEGLKLASAQNNVGIQAIITSMNLKSPLTSTDVGYIIGPILNSAGRLQDASMTVELLSTQCPLNANKICKQLLSLNEQRKEIEKNIFELALEQINTQKLNNKNFICVFGNNWHIGVIGIIAGKLKDKFLKPTFVISFNSDNVGKASARSISGIDLSKIINDAHNENLLLGGGGHKMAAGFSISKNMLEQFCEFLEKQIQLPKERNAIEIDACILPQDITIQFVKKFQLFEPFGNGNPQPIFAVKNAKLISSKIVKQKHIQATFQIDSSRTLQTISFNSANTAIGSALLEEYGKYFSLLGNLQINSWNSRLSVQMNLIDMYTERLD